MLESIAVPLILVILLYVGFRLYRPSWFQSPRENFVVKSTGPPSLSPINTPASPTPAPAPVVQAAPKEAPRLITPSGPSAPAAASSAPATISPEAKPIDPYEDNNMEAPISDSLRHPERSFGPGIEGNSARMAVSSGVASTKTLTSESPFSPDFAQNGGMFMGAVTANDLSNQDSYAVA